MDSKPVGSRFHKKLCARCGVQSPEVQGLNPTQQMGVFRLMSHFSR